MDWPDPILLVRKTADEQMPAGIPAGILAYAAEGKCPAGWMVERPLTAQERDGVIRVAELPHAEHLLNNHGLCFF